MPTKMQLVVAESDNRHSYNYLSSGLMPVLFSCLLVSMVIAFSSCNGDDPVQPNESGKHKGSDMSIISFVPAGAYPGDTIKINGHGFNPVTSNTKVIFSPNVEGIIITASTNQILTIVPDKAQSGRVSLINQGISTTSTIAFQILTPIIDNFYPKTADNGDTVTVTGRNFSPVISENTVKIGTLPATIVEAKSTMLRFIVPKPCSSGFISVTVKGGTTTSQNILKIIQHLLPFKNCIISITGVERNVVRYLSLTQDGDTRADTDTAIVSFDFSLDTREYPQFREDIVEKRFVDNRYIFSYESTSDIAGHPIYVAIDVDPTNYSIRSIDIHWETLDDYWIGEAHTQSGDTFLIRIGSIGRSSSGYLYEISGESACSIFDKLIAESRTSTKQDRIGYHFYETTMTLDHRCSPDTQISVRFVE